VSGGVSDSSSDGVPASAKASDSKSPFVYEAASARLVAQTHVDHQGYGIPSEAGFLCGGGEVLQPVEREGAALLDPQGQLLDWPAQKGPRPLFFSTAPNGLESGWLSLKRPGGAGERPF
jgi:hypothetical protein